MTSAKTSDTIQLLRRAADGDVVARDQAWSRVYDEVLRVAAAQRRNWSGNLTLETRVLASEVFLKLYGGRAPVPNDRKHFFVMVAQAIRQILVNYSVARSTAKRGGDAPHMSLTEFGEMSHPREAPDQLIDLHRALERFAKIDPRAALVVELRFFGGFSYEEIAETAEVSRATAVRDWNVARDWLNHELSDPPFIEEASESAHPAFPVAAEVLVEALAEAASSAESSSTSTSTSTSTEEEDVDRWPGTQVAAYHVLERIGKGGMSSVYRAHREGADESEFVALKILDASISSPGLQERFAIEQAGLHQLDHPGIVRILEGGETEDGTHWFTMDLVHGVPIDHWADERRLGLDERISLILSVGEIVSHAHARGILHRDLKPSNILVTEDGDPILLDFGIAKILDEIEGGNPSELTENSAVFTPLYGSPEQMFGEPVSAATDVYSLGALTWHLLIGAPPVMNLGTGKPLYPVRLLTKMGDGAVAVAEARGTDLDSLLRDLSDKALIQVLIRACHWDLAERFASVEALAGDLRAFSSRR